MRALLLGVCLACLVGEAGAETPPVSVYGIEIDVRGEQERVLVFGSRDLGSRVTERGPERVELLLPRAVLDPTAPTRVQPLRAGAVLEVRAVEERGEGAPQVRISIRRRAGAAFAVEERGATLAVAFRRTLPSREGELALSFDNAPLSEIVGEIARATGQTFLYDEDALSGRASIVLMQRIGRDEALSLLHSLLHLAGFAAVASPGGAFRVVPIADSPTASSWRPSGKLGESDAPVATALRLRAMDAERAAALLGPHSGAHALVVPHVPSNTLLISGPEALVRKLFELADALDNGAVGEVWVHRLRHRDAREMARRVDEILAGRPGRSSRAQVSADPRAQLLVVVAPAEELLEIRGFVEQLDRPPESDGEIHVWPLRHADPEEMVAVLQKLAANGDPDASRAGRALAGRFLRVAAERQTSSLLVRTDPASWRLVAAVLEELDRPPPRIEVEITLLEVMTSAGLELGFDALIPVGDPSSKVAAVSFLNPSGGGLFQPGGAGGPAFGARLTRSPIEVPILGPGGVPITVLAPRESFVLTADEGFAASRVLQRPHLTLLAGQEHELFAGDNVPVVVASATQGSDRLQTRNDVQRHDVGVRLRVGASIGEADRVRLELDVETSRVASRAGNPRVRTGTGPVFEERKLTTAVWLDDELPVLVGGAKLEQRTLSEVGIPWLRDVPLLGLLAKSRREEEVDVSLVVAAQVRVHRDGFDDVAATIRRRLGLERALARSAPLVRDDEPSWALRVATRDRADDANAIAEHFRLAGERAEVSEWRWAGRTRHDVLLSGYPTIAAAGAAAERVRAAGFSPELVPVRAKP